MRIFDDLSFVIRRLRRAPGFALTTVLMLSLGIGLSVSMFSALRGVVLNALPFADAQALVAMHSSNPRQDTEHGQLTPAEAQALRAGAGKDDSALADFGFYNWGGITVFDGTQPREASLIIADAGFFSTLGMQPLYGRVFTAEEYGTWGSAVILSYREFQRLLGGRPEAIGSSIDTSEGRLQVVGVMPPVFAYPSEDIGAWMPRTPFNSAQPSFQHARFVFGVGRLKSGLSAEAIGQRLDAIGAQVREQFRLSDSGWRLSPTPAADEIVGDVRGTLQGALAIALLVMLIACANVAILFDARQVEQAQALALSEALGASPSRLWQARVLELSVLAALGVVGGLLLAWFALDILRILASGSVPRAEHLALDPAVIGFALLLGVATPIVALGAGALRHRTSAAAVMRGGRGMVGADHGQRRWLPACALAVSTVSLVTAFALASSMQGLQAVDPGFRSDNIHAMQLFRYGSPESAGQFAAALRERLTAIPEATDVALTSAAPLSSNGAFSVDLKLPERTEAEPFQAALRRIDAGYARVLEIPLINGRQIEDSDRDGSEKVAVINRELARRSFGAQSAVGQTLLLPLGQGERVAYRVVGVVEDIHNDGLRAPPSPEIWIAFAQNPQSSMTLLVRSAGSPTGLAARMAAQVWDLDPRQALTRQFTLAGEISAQLQTVRFFTLTVGAFALIAVLLGGLGVYAVTSLQQRRRVREFGLRLAIGARPLSLGAQVLGGGLHLVAVGGALGMAGAWLSLWLIAAQTYGLEQQRPWVMLSGVLAMSLVALLALALPALRAARLDPITALRQE
jgi:predicted permease